MEEVIAGNGVTFALSEDNWKHRSKGMRCRTCMFFVEKSSNVMQPEYHLIGRCRRNAPVVVKGWSVVFSDDWCGEHKIDENKV